MDEIKAPVTEIRAPLKISPPPQPRPENIKIKERSRPENQDQIKLDQIKLDQAKLDQAKLDQATEELNKVVQQNQINLAFSVDKDTGRTVIKIIDSETEEVLRQLPPEELLKLAATMDEWVGHLLSAKA